MRILLRILAVLTAIFAMRYFVVPPVWVPPPTPAALAHVMADPGAQTANAFARRSYDGHPILLLAHISCGITALLLGLVQFVPSVRDSKPHVHRAIGTIYVGAVIAGGAMGFVLTLFMPSVLGAAMTRTFLPVILSFALLSITWFTVTLIAFQRARRGRYDEHRAWMIRSYSLTFAAASVRIVSPLILLIVPSVVFATNVGICSWPLNLLVAEWLLWRSAHRLPQPVPAPLR